MLFAYERLLSPILLKKSAAKLFEMVRGAKRARVLLCSVRHWGGQWDQLCQLSEVLDCGIDEELVLSTRRTSQPKPFEAQDALEMCEQHLDLLPFAPRRHAGLSLGDVARNVSGVLVNRTRDLAGGHLRTALAA
jgi:hypothetical protein